MTRLRPRWLLNRCLHVVRQRWLRRQMRSASAYVMGSRAIFDWHREHDLFGPGSPVWVLPYGVEPAPPPTERPAGGLPTFGLIGAVMPHKGAHIAVASMAGLAGRARLEVWGNLEADPAYASELRRTADPEVVSFHGRFPDDQRASVLGRFDALLVPSIGLESFGIAAREAMAAGVPVIASRIGALAELEIDDRCGATFTPGDAAELRSLVEGLVQDPDLLECWRRRLPSPLTVAEHAAQIDGVYEEVLRRHRGRGRHRV